MAKLKMKKIEITGLLSDRKKIVERLQREGVLEFVDGMGYEISGINVSDSILQFEKGIAVATEAQTILQSYAPVKKSLTSALSGKKKIEKKEFGKMAGQRDVFLNYCYDLVSCHKKILECQASIVRTEVAADALQIWLSLDVPMQTRGTKSTLSLIGTLPGQKSKEEILAAMKDKNPQLELFSLEIISSFKLQTCIAVLCHRSVAEETLSLLREMDLVLPSEPAKEVPRDRQKQLEQEIEQYKLEIEKNIEKIKSYADKAEEIEFLIDYLTMRRDKYAALQKVGHTKNTIVVTGYIPEKYADKLILKLEAKYPVAIELTNPTDDEDIPVLLENNGFSAPMEAITEMYALPTKKDPDPSSVMAFFYYLFFGMMLSDAGYGLVMTILSAVLLTKFNLKDSMKKTFQMFLYCGISTVFWGALFGSWFGDIVQVVALQFFDVKIGTLALWFDPIKDPMTLLILAFLLGIAHLFLGLAVNFKLLWQDGRKADAIFDVIPVYLLVLGAVPLGGSILTPIPPVLISAGSYLAIAGALLIILTNARSSKNIATRLGGGLYGLYNIASGYLSDILSYSRLLALGLATGSIAGVVNLMGTMVDNKIAKAVLLIVVFCLGHPLNIAINLLGAYVHTNRLQFVEFFSKFYEGGGRAFQPLKVNTQYIQFKEEN